MSDINDLVTTVIEVSLISKEECESIISLRKTSGLERELSEKKGESGWKN